MAAADMEQQQLKQSSFDQAQTFRRPKKIAFSSLMGGSSHSHWVISIMDELHTRGHEVSYITKVLISFCIGAQLLIVWFYRMTKLNMVNTLHI